VGHGQRRRRDQHGALPLSQHPSANYGGAPDIPSGASTRSDRGDQSGRYGEASRRFPLLFGLISRARVSYFGLRSRTGHERYSSHQDAVHRADQYVGGRGSAGHVAQNRVVGLVSIGEGGVGANGRSPIEAYSSGRARRTSTVTSAFCTPVSAYGSRRYPHAPIRPSRRVGWEWRGVPAAPSPDATPALSGASC
jgi:hypothetical protein